MKSTVCFFGLLLVLPILAKAQTEPPQFMTVDGRLYDSTTPDEPLLDGSVHFRIQILNPLKTCILYEEQQTTSTLVSNGYFNLRVGSPTSGPDSLKRTTSTIDVGNSMMEVFQNQNAAIAGKTAGGANCSYTPATGDSRYFRYIVTPSTTGTPNTLFPDMTVDSVPQSLVAETLQGMTPDRFVQTNADVTQAKMNTLLGASYGTLTGLIAGSSTLYLRNAATGTVIPNRTTDPVSHVAGQIWYDSDDNEFRYSDGVAIHAISAGGADPTKLPLTGGTMQGAIDMGGNDITDTGHITMAAQRSLRMGVFTTAQQATLIATPLIAGHEGTFWYNTTTNKLMFWDGTAEQTVTPVESVHGRTGAVVAVASDYDAVQVDNTPAGTIAATNVQAALDELDSEKVAKSGDTMTGHLNIDNEQELRLSEADGSGANYVALKSPTTLAGNYTLTLPDTAGSANQVLTTDGSGVLSWTTPASAGEVNTASNQGAAGVGVYDAKVGVDIQFRNINAASNKVSVALDGPNKEIDINVNEANFDAGVIPNTPSGTVAAANVQAAINELDTEKVATTRAINTAAGSGLTGGGDLSADRSLSVDITGTTAETTVAAGDEILIYDTSATALRKMTRENFVLSEAEVDAMVSDNGYLTAEADTLATVTGRGASTATNITMNTQAQTRYADSAGGEYAAIQAPATIGTNYILTLPDTAGAANQVLTTDGSGVLSWTTPSTVPSANSLDFTHFVDAMTLDASTDIAVTGTNVLSITNSGTSDSFRVNDQTADTTPFVIDASGNVGVGTSSPQAAFHVYNGSIAIEPGYNFGYNSNNNYKLIGGATHHNSGTGHNINIDVTNSGMGAFSIYKGARDAAGTLLFRLLNSGNVGIGTITPNTLLDVSGAITSRPHGTAAGETGKVIMHELAANGTNSATIRSPDVLAADYILTLPTTAGAANQVLSTNGSGVLSWVDQSSFSIADDSLNFDKFADNMTLDANTDISVGTYVLAITNDGAGNSFRVNDNGAADTTPFVIDAAGQVGIGTSSPGSILHVTGTSSTKLTIEDPTNTGFTTVLNLRRENSAGVGSGTMGSYLNFEFEGATEGSTIFGARISNRRQGDFAIAVNDGGTLENKLNIDGTYFTIMNSNVGIGTTTPGTLLDVAGAITSRPNGTGTGQTGQLLMRELAASPGGTDTVAIRAPDSITTSYSLTLPGTAGSANQVLTTDGSGVLSWTSGGAASIADDSLNFDKFIDNMTLDADTDIAVGTYVLAITNDGAGNSFRVNDNGAADTSPFVIDASGNVGVGSASPSVKLDVTGAIAATSTVDAGGGFYSSGNQNTPYAVSSVVDGQPMNGASSTGQLRLSNWTSGDNLGNYIIMAPRNAAGNYQNSYIGTVSQTGAGTYSPVMVFGSQTAASAYSERMRIDGSGYLGVGTSVPGTLLDIAGAITSRPYGTNTGETGQLIMRELAAGGTDTVAIRAPDAIGTSYSLTLPATAGSANQVLTTDGSGVLSWTSGGAASIADDSLNFDKFSDSMTLDANTDISVGAYVLAITNDGAGDSFRVNDNGAGDTSPFVIDTNGNVGMGTTTPGVNLHILGSNPYLKIQNSNNGTSYLGMQVGASSRAANIEILNASGTAVSTIGGFVGNATNANRVYLDNGNGVAFNIIGSSGSDPTINNNAGLGTVTPKNRLHVYESNASTNTVTNILRLEHESTGTPASNFGTGIIFSGESSTTSNTDMAQIDSIWTDSTHATRTSALRLNVVNNGGSVSEAVRVSGDGKVGIGTTSPGTLLDVAGAITSRPHGTNPGETGKLIMRELAAGGTETATIRAPDAITTSYSLTLPATAGSANQVLTTDGSGILSWTSPSTTLSLSSLTAAGAINTLANANYAQTWNWDTLTTQTAMTMGSTSATTGTILNLVNSFDSATSTGNVLKLRATGTSNAAVPLMITNSGTGNSLRINDDGTDTDTTPFVVASDGRVGVGTSSPRSLVHLENTGTGFVPSLLVQNKTAGSGNATGILFNNYGANWRDQGGIAFGDADGNSGCFRFIVAEDGNLTNADLTKTTMSVCENFAGVGTKDPQNYFHIHDPLWYDYAGLLVTSQRAVGATSGGLTMNATVHTPTATSQRLGGTYYGGTLPTSGNYQYSAGVLAYSQQAWSDTAAGASLRFVTTPNDTLTPQIRATILNSGEVGIGTTSPGTLLDVAGAITSRPNGTGAGQTGQLLMRELAASPGGTDTVAIRAPDSITTSYALTLPATAGSANQVLTTNGSGVLSWTASGAAGVADDGLNFDKFSDAMTLDASTDIAVGAYVLAITNDGAGNSFRVNDNGAADTSPFVIDASGNVGIGTTTATSKLEVNGRIVSSLVTDADALIAITVDFSSANVIDATGASAACGTLNITNTVSGGSFTVTIPNATATCTTIHWNGSATGVKLPAGYVGGVASAGLVYSFIHSGSLLWVTNVTY